MNFEIRIATISEIQEKWNYEIKNHPDDNRWMIWRNVAIANVKRGNRLCFYGFLNDEIIAEGTAVISQNDTGLENKEFVFNDAAYIEAFRVNKEHRGKGYFSRLFCFMEKHLQGLGFKNLILGVEPDETRNLEIYKHLGFDKFLAEKIEKYPPKKEGEEGEEYLVHYYLKEIKQ